MRFSACLTRLARPALAAAALAACAAPAAAQQLRVQYGVSILGIPLGRADLSGQVDPATYKVAVNAKLTGVAALVTSSRGAATASGALARGSIVPAAYANTSANSRETRTIRMSMGGGAVKGVDISPPIDNFPDRVPLTDAHKRNVLDPLSALVIPVPGAEATTGPAACNRTLPVYDGLTRFDVKLTYTGTRQVKAQGYAGAVAVCAVRYTPIAGHRQRKSVQFMEDNRDIEVWLAPVGQTRFVVPFRIAVATMIGKTVIEAEQFSVEGGGMKAGL